MTAVALRPTVLLADDQALFRSGLARLLEDDGRVEVAGQARDGEEAVSRALELKPAAVLIDVRMPRCDGIEATVRILEALPETKVLVLSSLESEREVLAALRAGAAGYVLKDGTVESIVSSIMAALAGETVIGARLARQLLPLLSGAAAALESSHGLTQRELEVLRLMAAGLSNKQIGYRMRLSEKTVRNHVSRVYRKLGVNDRAQAALAAARMGLVET